MQLCAYIDTYMYSFTETHCNLKCTNHDGYIACYVVIKWLHNINYAS